MRHRFTVRLFATSFINIAVILAGVFAFLQFSFMDSVHADIQERDEEVLRQIQKRIDENLIAMRRIALSISLDSAFSPFYLPDAPLKAVEGIRSLRNYALVSTDISLVGIAYGNSNFALTDKGSITKEYFTIYEIPPYEHLVAVDTIDRGFIANEHTIAFVFPYPVQTPSAPRGAIFILVRSDNFTAGLREQNLGLSRFITIVDAAGGDILFSNRPTEAVDSVVTEFVSEGTGYRYRIATPRTYFASMLNALRLKSAIVVLSLFGLGVLINWTISRYNAEPLRKILGKFAKAGAEENFESVESLLSEQRVADERARRDIFLLNLMQGSFSNHDELRSQAYLCGLDFSGEVLGFLIVNGLSNGGEPIRSALDSTTIGENRFYRQRVLSGENEVWAYSGNSSSLTDDTILRFRETAYGIDTTVTIGTGTVSSYPRDAAKSFLEAMTAVNYRLVRGRGSIIRFENLPRTDAIDFAALDSLLESLKAELQRLDTKMASQTVATILDIGSKLSLSGARGVLWRLLQSFDDQDLIRTGVPVRRMTDFDEVEKLVEFVRGLTDNILAKLKGELFGAENEIVAEIKTYIEVHFDDQNLSLDSLADSLGYSVGYLCRVFKKATGTTVASCIQDLRIHEACRLLRVTNLPVKEIVQKIGYMDHASFSRSFKTQIGFSPHDYRARYKTEAYS